MRRNVRLRAEDLEALLAMTATARTESGARLRDWVLNEQARRKKCGELGGRSKRDGGEYPKPTGDDIWIRCDKPDYDAVTGEWIYFETHAKLGKRIIRRETALEDA